MSRRNREKRAAKQKARRQGGANARPSGPPPTGFRSADERAMRHEAMIDGIRRAATCTCGDIDGHAAELLDAFAAEGRALESATDTALTRMIGEAWRRGWQPLDVVEFARRRTDPVIAGFVTEAIVLESQRYAAATVHPRWRAQVAGMGAGVVTPAPGESHLRAWLTRVGLGRQAGLGAALQVLSLLCGLPVFERLLPLPGESRHRVEQQAPGEVDQRALAKVRALLAKAESSRFPEEAEALSAKAQELMSRHSLHQAVLDHDSGRAPVVSGRRMWLDAPYADAKALLVQEVAAANRARMVWSSRIGFATVIGADADLDAIELLTTSLLVQANRAMLAEGSQITRAGTSRTRSFRQSFLISYATRIGERLVAADSAATAEVGAEIGAAPSAPGAEPQADSRLLPVLVARASATDALADELFPNVVAKGFSVSNTAGWAAGRAAADQAQFGVRGSIAG